MTPRTGSKEYGEAGQDQQEGKAMSLAQQSAAVLQWLQGFEREIAMMVDRNERVTFGKTEK